MDRLTLQDIMDEARSRQRRPSATRTTFTAQLFTLFKRHENGQWYRFTSQSMPLNEAMKVWPDLPGDFCVRPINKTAN